MAKGVNKHFGRIEGWTCLSDRYGLVDLEMIAMSYLQPFLLVQAGLTVNVQPTQIQRYRGISSDSMPTGELISVGGSITEFSILESRSCFHVSLDSNFRITPLVGNSMNFERLVFYTN